MTFVPSLNSISGLPLPPGRTHHLNSDVNLIIATLPREEALAILQVYSSVNHVPTCIDDEEKNETGIETGLPIPADGLSRLRCTLNRTHEIVLQSKPRDIILQ